jgi:hypothetical protein
MGKNSHTQEPVTRRNLLKKGAAGALGAAAVTAITASPASAADGDPIILGEENFASSPTVIKQTQPEISDSLSFGGGFLSAVSAEGPIVFGTLDLRGGFLRVATDFISPAISASTPLGGPAISADAQGTGIIASGIHGPGVRGESADVAGVHGRSDHGTGVVAEAGPHVQFEGTAFEALGPVKFSTSGLADVAASTDRVTVAPGVPVTSQSKVLAMLQGNSGNKAMVEHVELNAVASTFQVVLTKVPARPVQIAWFLIS